MEIGGRAAPVGAGGEAGQETATGPGSRAVLLFADGTRVVLGDQTSVRCWDEDRGRRVDLERGRIAAEVRPQRRASPFVAATAVAEAIVVGTRFRLMAGPALARLDVEEGRVVFRRRSDGAEAAVAAGHYALASAEERPMAWPKPPEEIVLVPSQGRIVGAEWRLVRDPAALSGAALETTRHDEKTGGMTASRSFVAFTFQAEADRDYRVWVRGRCLETRDSPWSHDAVALLPLGGRFDRPCADAKTRGTDAHLFNGYADDPGLRGRYFWIGGNGLDASVTLRFARPGPQTLQLHAMESPMRVDAIWHSTARRDRPGPDARPPR